MRHEIYLVAADACAICRCPEECAKVRCVFAEYRKEELLRHGDVKAARRIFGPPSVFEGAYIPPWELAPEKK